jgi:hypothetical protein
MATGSENLRVQSKVAMPRPVLFEDTPALAVNPAPAALPKVVAPTTHLAERAPSPRLRPEIVSPLQAALVSACAPKPVASAETSESKRFMAALATLGRAELDLSAAAPSVERMSVSELGAELPAEAATLAQVKVGLAVVYAVHARQADELASRTWKLMNATLRAYQGRWNELIAAAAHINGDRRNETQRVVLSLQRLAASARYLVQRPPPRLVEHVRAAPLAVEPVVTHAMREAAQRELLRLEPTLSAEVV